MSYCKGKSIEKQRGEAIKEVINRGVMGDFYGENIAFSPRNFEIYRLGTKIVIRDFDYRRGVAGPGFYFSRTEDAAEICYRKMVGGR